MHILKDLTLHPSFERMSHQENVLKTITILGVHNASNDADNYGNFAPMERGSGKKEGKEKIALS